MAKSVLELAVGTGQWDAGLKKARTALDNFTQANGGLQSALTKDSASMQKFVQMMGRMDSTAKTAKGQMNDYKGTIEQLTMQYNRLTDAQKKTIGQDYLRSIDQMKQKYQGVAEEVQKINQSLKSMPEPAAMSGGGLFGGDNLSGMLQVFGGNVMTKLAGVGVGFVSELKDMVAQGIELARAGEGVRIAFQRLGRGDLLDGLREATHGTVTDLELMKAAVKFNDFKLPLEELGTMLAFAQQKAKDTGQSVDYMVDSIVTGLGRKSLMILDNLGLSAAEIKEKMKDTGDMTKAVGEIIREQMANAGEYIETAADRATKANVELENAMTRLGDTFQPLTDAANDMWTSIKVSCLDLISSAVQPLIDKLTEAGRLRAQLNNINAGTGTNQTRAGKDLNYLKYEIGKYGANDPRITDLYNRQRGRYIQQENQAWRQAQSAQQRYEQKRKDGASQSDLNAYYQRWQTMEAQAKAWGSVLKEYDEGFKKLTSSAKVDIKTDEAEQNITSLTNKLKDLQSQRKKAIAAGDDELSKSLLKQINQVKADIKGLGGSTSTTTTKQPKTEIEKNQAKIKDLTQEYIKLGDQETEASKNRQIEIQKEIELLQKRNNLIGVRTEQAQGKLMGGDVQQLEYKNLPYIIDRSHLFDTEGGIGWQKLQKYNDQTSVSEYKRRQKEYVKNNDKEGKGETKSVSEEMSKITMSVSGIFNGIEQLGIELPQGLKDVLGGIQAVAGILTAISSLVTIITALQSAKSVPIIGWALANGGVVHAADGYQVPGNRMSGDQVPAMLNSGELVLNKAQQGNLASQLQGGMGAMQLSAIITGEQLRLVLNNNGRRTGRGEYVTTNFR